MGFPRALDILLWRPCYNVLFIYYSKRKKKAWLIMISCARSVAMVSFFVQYWLLCTSAKSLNFFFVAFKLSFQVISNRFFNVALIICYRFVSCMKHVQKRWTLYSTTRFTLAQWMARVLETCFNVTFNKPCLSYRDD